MPNQIQIKDAQQDQEIALLTYRVEQLEDYGDFEKIDELRSRVRRLERLVWGAGAAIIAAIAILGIVMAVDAKEIDYGRNDTPKQEKLLQLPRS